ncbi:MAG: hypothetical protein MPW14_24515 [Candidatus Manganitrophus sp.]|nr:MAG: hypothetical protein MPW14_24515 [Candidatus Manganitrophus sp.]
MRYAVLAGLGLILLSSAAFAETKAEADIINGQGEKIGTATFTEGERG